MNEKKVKWGIAGLGNIAHRFAQDLTNNSQFGELQAVAARDSDKAQQFSATYKAVSHYGDYQKLAMDPNIDIIYVATIHPYHKPLVELFLSHHKNVLVEKPAFTNYQDWQDMQQLAKDNDVLLLEAMKTVVFPAYRELKVFLSKHEIIVDSIEASFGNESEYDPNIFVFNSELSGGATLDVGVYGVWLYCDLCYFFGKDVPLPSVSITTEHPEWRVDENVTFLFEGKIKGKISASISKNLPRSAILKGDGIEIVIHDKWWNPSRIDVNLRGKVHTITHDSGGGFEHEIDHCSVLLLNNEQTSSVLNTKISGQVLSILEQALITNGYTHLTRR
ncbi:gfo/Idh/MocA family oxidoreductase [Aliivibrio fischeri]|uniref:Gfo/Idh/MocA family oxidoreductase n=1 Tax=Aliivibrio fischeri TaxID=668 RepID=A0A6N3Z5D8_ALIFS|nr:Gfo/Idh/MocA family oxidoreductase [Aliivibrio fischeri]MUK44533.1 gfo/Idh/MocA family oxidoreductase [Aliivibrio fischeri]MUK79884.1 gfo/Idh/MocA family oxidoreductase [Aliivibrio fischeri]MUK85604.1 gfo/Idh/MocA family oxidoreductase [Aliivibrio fischeri]